MPPVTEYPEITEAGSGGTAIEPAERRAILDQMTRDAIEWGVYDTLPDDPASP